MGNFILAFDAVAQVVCLVLKLRGIVNWDWWSVFTPTWIALINISGAYLVLRLIERWR